MYIHVACGKYEHGMIGCKQHISQQAVISINSGWLPQCRRNYCYKFRYFRSSSAKRTPVATSR